MAFNLPATPRRKKRSKTTVAKKLVKTNTKQSKAGDSFPNETVDLLDTTATTGQILLPEDFSSNTTISTELLETKPEDATETNTPLPTSLDSPLNKEEVPSGGIGEAVTEVAVESSQDIEPEIIEAKKAMPTEPKPISGNIPVITTLKKTKPSRTRRNRRASNKVDNEIIVVEGASETVDSSHVGEMLELADDIKNSKETTKTVEPVDSETIVTEETISSKKNVKNKTEPVKKPKRQSKKTQHGRRKAPVENKKNKTQTGPVTTVISETLTPEGDEFAQALSKELALIETQPTKIKATLPSLVSADGRITVPLKLKNKTFKSVLQPILSVIIFGLATLVFAIAGRIAFEFRIDDFKTSQIVSTIAETTLWVGLISIVTMIISIIAVVEHNRQLRLQTTQIAEAFNSRYGMKLNYIDVCDLTNDFRLPINVNNLRTDIRLTTLRRGKDARLVHSGTGVEIPSQSAIIRM